MAWNRSTTNVETKVSTKSAGKNGLVIGCVAVVLILSGVVLYLSLRRGENPPPHQKPVSKQQKIAAVTPAKVKPAKVEPEVQVDQKKLELEKIRAKVKRMNADDRQAYAEELLAKREIDLEPKTNRPFMTSVELQMARIFTKELGDIPPPPMPPISSYEYLHLTQILIADNPVLPTDSEEWKEAKQIVEVAKKEMRQYIKEGGDPDNFLNYYYGKLADAYNERMTCTRELMKTAVAEPEIASEVYRRFNERLEAKGIKKIELSDQIKEKYSIQD